MKLETQRDRWQAVLDGYELKNGKGVRFKMGEAGLVYLPPEYSEWLVSASSLYAHNNDDLTWQLYEPPKPENKVIVIKESNVMNGYEFDNEIFDTENDAIRAAMEWIGEKTRKVKIKRPEYMHTPNEIHKQIWGDNVCYYGEDLRRIANALLMRWPIEVLEEV